MRRYKKIHGIYPSDFELCCHSPRNAPALETISTALPTIVCSPELVVVGEANPLLDVAVVKVWMMGLGGVEEDTAVKDVLGFARRGGGGMRGGGRSLVGGGIDSVSSGLMSTPIASDGGSPMTVLVDEEHDEVVEENVESGTIFLASPASRVVLVPDPLPARAPELTAVAISLPAKIFSDVLSLPLLSLPLSISLSFSFSFSRPPARTKPSILKLPIGLPTTELPSRSNEEDEDVVRVLDLPRDCG